MVRGEGCRLFDTHGNEVGARLDSIHNRVVAALVFKHDQHVINLFVWPIADLKGRRSHIDDPRRLQPVALDVPRMSFWALSDVKPAALRRFEAGYDRQTNGSSQS
jgi:hypothetical protein